MPGIVTQAREFRAALLANERAQQEEMVRQWLALETRLRDQMLVLAYQLQGQTLRPGSVQAVSLHQIAQMERFQRLLNQTQAELAQYSDGLIAQVRREQAAWARQGAADAQALVFTAVNHDPGAAVVFGTLPVQAVQNFTAWSGGSGSPSVLGDLLKNAFVDPNGSMPRGWQTLQEALVKGLGLGWHPEKTAKAMAQALSGGLQRAMTIARTEQIRAYRSASLQAYEESGVVKGHKRLTAHDSRVCAACLADEGHLYALDEMMWSHPQCRCTSVPVLKNGPEPQWEMGEEWLRKQDEATQNKIFGSVSAAEAFRQGVPLKEFMRVTKEGDWGTTIRVQNPVHYMGYPGGAKQPSLFPTAQANVNLNPLGQDISSHLTLPKSGKYKPAYQNAVDLIESVHGDGPLPEVVLSTRDMGKGTYGGFVPHAGGWEIWINGKETPHVESTVIHEIGHWIDRGGLGSGGLPATAAPDQGPLKNWWSQIQASNEYTELKNYQGDPGTRHYIDRYLLSPVELWARSYAQYIGQKTQNNEILATMEWWRQRGDYSQFRQWDPQGFQKIFDEIDQILTDQGWMK